MPAHVACLLSRVCLTKATHSSLEIQSPSALPQSHIFLRCHKGFLGPVAPWLPHLMKMAHREEMGWDFEGLVQGPPGSGGGKEQSS